MVKKIFWNSLFFILFLAVVFFAKGLMLQAASNYIDPAKTYQTFEGWGTSLAGDSYLLSGISNTDKNTVADLLFSKDKGLGLTIVRYNIAGGDNPSRNTIQDSFKAESFQPTEGVWDWNADQAQRWFLKAAQNRGATTFEAYANSAPYYMTNSLSSTGAKDSSSNNLRDDSYEKFADYLTEVVKHFKDDSSIGVTFSTLEPLNEPLTSYWGYGGRQEGSHFDIDKQALLIKAVDASLKKKGLSTKISATDENNIADAVKEFKSFDTDTLNAVSQINVHSYNGGDGDRRALQALAAAHGKKISMSEYGCCLGGKGTKNMLGAVTLASRISSDLRYLKANSWIIWQPSWGIVKVSLGASNPSTITILNQYYALLNYTKFIRPGYKIIESNTPNTVAAYSEADHRLVLVSTNTSSTTAQNLSYNLSAFNNLSEYVAVYRTSSTENLATLSPIKIPSNKVLDISLPPFSVTTVVVTTNGNTNSSDPVVPPPVDDNQLSTSTTPKPVPDPSASCVSISNYLEQNSTDQTTNGEVTILQKFLVSKGYLDISQTVKGYGVFGGYTKAAVQAFQKANNIEAGGTVGPATREKIKAITCTIAIPEVPLSGSERFTASMWYAVDQLVRAFRQDLAKLGL